MTAAKRRIEADAAGPSRFTVEPADDRRIAEEFVAACAGGEVEPLMRLLDADVVGDVDLGAAGVRRPVHGRPRVAAGLVRFLGGPAGVTLVTQSIDDQPGALAFRNRALIGWLVLEIRAGLITEVHTVADPQQVARVAALLDRNR